MDMTEEQRFREAFEAELKTFSQVPPRPSRLADRMGLGNRNTLNGRLSRLRRELLLEAGFKKDQYKNRWYKP